MSEEQLALLKKQIELLDEHAVYGTGFGNAVEAAKALLAEVERLRARVAELEAPREGILADAQARRGAWKKQGYRIEELMPFDTRPVTRDDIIGGIAPAVNPAAGQDGE